MAKMIRVMVVPNWGVPEESSNIEPTAEIAAIQQIANNTPLFRVTDLS